MTRRTALLSAAALPFLRPAPAFPQGGQEPKRASPHETVSVDLSAGTTITISYGRPYLKGRTVGKDVAPYGQVWRLGADEATKITVTARIKITGGPELAAGSYSLYAIPGPDKWTIIVNKIADQWGTRYDQSQDLARFDLKVQKTPAAAEQLTISLQNQTNSTAKLTITWGNDSVSAILKVA